MQTALTVDRQGVPIVMQWKRIQSGTMRLWVRSLASLSGLRIWHCHELWYRSQIRLGSGIAVAVVVVEVSATPPIRPQPGNLHIATPPKKEEDQKKKKKNG